MDKLMHYRELIKQHIRHLADLVNYQYRTDEGEGIAHSVFDDEGACYLLVKAGWSKGRRSHGTTLFVRVHNGKIYIEEDWTEDGIANALIDAGVPEEDVVLAFQAPSTRKVVEAGQV